MAAVDYLLNARASLDALAEMLNEAAENGTSDIPIPRQDVQAQWKRVQARRAAQARFSPIDEQHTRVHISAESGGAAPGA